MNELDYYITRLEGGESKMRLCMSINIDTLHGIKKGKFSRENEAKNTYNSSDIFGKRYLKSIREMTGVYM